MLSSIQNDLMATLGKEQEEPEELFLSLKGRKSLRASMEEFYYEHICHLPGVEAILCEALSDITHFITILSTRDVETREKIYSVELNLFELYQDSQVTFSVSYLHNSGDLHTFSNHKKVLFQKQTGYGEQRRPFGHC
jgi:hypothetical protein